MVLLAAFFDFDCQDGVVLGADTRSTGHEIIVDGNCKKIHYLADNIL